MSAAQNEQWVIYRRCGWIGWLGFRSIVRYGNGDVLTCTETEARRYVGRWNEQNTNPPGPCSYEARRLR